MVERKEGHETVQSVEGTRDKIGGTLNQAQQIEKFKFMSHDLETKVSCSDGAMTVRWNAPGFAGKLYITLFVEGAKEPISIYLGEDATDEVILTEEELGFRPDEVPFNYMIHPKTSE